MQCNGLTTRSKSFTHAVSGLLDMCVRQDSSCSWSIGHCSSFVGVLVRVFHERGNSLKAVSPSLSLPFFPLFYQCDRCLFFLLPRGGSWLGCLDLPAMGAVSIQELAANSGSSWMSQAPNLHFARQLITRTALESGNSLHQNTKDKRIT